MTNIKYKILAISMMALCVGLSSVNVSAEPFHDALNKTLANHPTIESLRAAQMNVKDQKAEQKSALYPEINISATGGRVFGDNATSRGLSVTRGEGYSYLWEGSAAITQKLFDGYESFARISAAEQRFHAAGQDVMDVKETLSLQIASAYFDVMRTTEALEMIEAHNTKINDYRERIVLMVEEGAADEAELKQAEDITILLDNILVEYHSQQRAAKAAYEQLTGERPQGEMMAPEWNRDLFPISLEEAEIELAKHPAMESLDYTLQAGVHEVDAEKAAFYPDINAELSYLKKDVADIIGGEVDDARAVVKLNWSFSTGGAQFARVRQRQASVIETRAQKAELERQLSQALQQAWIEYETSAKVLENMQRRREINKDLFETNKAQFEGAQIRLLQLMQSENQYFQTRLETVNAAYRNRLSELSVLASLGRLQSAFDVVFEDVAQ